MNPEKSPLKEVVNGIDRPIIAAVAIFTPLALKSGIEMTSTHANPVYTVLGIGMAISFIILASLLENELGNFTDLLRHMALVMLLAASTIATVLIAMSPV